MKRTLTWALAAIPLLAACDESTTSGPEEAMETQLAVYLTDAPGDVANVWVNIGSIYFQGGPGGRLDVLTEPTGPILLTELTDSAIEIVSGLEVDPGQYRQLRFILLGAVLEDTEGNIYSYEDMEHPDGLEITGDLICPGCGNSGIKVKLAGDALDVGDGENGMVLDFDVAQSFGKPAGRSGKWVMKPVIHAVKVDDGEDPETPGAGASVSGSVMLATDSEGAEIELPACPEGTPRSVKDFVPTATAATLVDDAGEPIMRSGEVGEDGSYSIDFLSEDSYAFGHVSPIELGDWRLVFEATVDPAESHVAGDVSDVDYVIQSAVCEANPAQG